MIFEFEYRIVGANGCVMKVLGLQVGRFAVRLAPQGFGLKFADRSINVSGQWLVDHVPSGCTVAILKSFADAMIVADDMSRFSHSDPKFKNMHKSVTAVGNNLNMWAVASSREGRAVGGGFRQWYRAKLEELNGGSASQRRCRARGSGSNNEEKLMAFYKRKPGDPIPPPARVYRYGLPFGPEDEQSRRGVRGQMLRASEYQSELATIMQAGRERYRQIVGASADVAELQQQIDTHKVEITELNAAVRARRAAARSKNVLAPELARIEELRTSLKPLVEAVKLAKKSLKDPAIVAAITANNKRCNTEEREARARIVLDVPEGPEQQARDGLYWSTYNLISASVRQACETPTGPAIREYWNGEGRIAVQLQGGLTVPEVLAGQDTQLRIEEVPRVRSSKLRRQRCAHGSELGGDLPCGCRSRTTQTMLRIRIGSTAKKQPVWASFAMVYVNEKRAGDVRPLPQDGIVKLAVVTKRRVGTREHWELHLTVVSEENRPPAVRELKEHAALDIGWRARLPGLRVFFLAGSDGQRRELICPKNIENGFDKADDLRAVRDKLFNGARDQLRDYLKLRAELPGETPAWLLEATETLPHWRSVAKLSRLVSRWRDLRFEGDAGIFGQMLAWWQKNRHLYQWESSQRQKTKNRRNKYYRILAKEVVLQYASITLEELDLRPLIERGDLNKEELHATARRNRFIAAPGIFRQYLLEAAGKHGTVVLKKPAAFTTITCSVCGEVDQFDKRKLESTCRNGHRWDQDQNAAQNLLHASG